MLYTAYPQVTEAEKLLAASSRTDDVELVAAIRQQRGEVRAAFGRALDSATRASSGSRRSDYLRRAQRLAFANQRVWGDRFLIDQFTRFQNWSGEQRAKKLYADDLRRAGNSALDESGVAAAMSIWRNSERVARHVPDSVGIAASLGNIGAGFYRQGELDSAKRYLTASRILAARVGDTRTSLNALGTLGVLSMYLGRTNEARSIYKTALPLRRRIGDWEGEVADHNNLGLLAEGLEDYPGARREYLLAAKLAVAYRLDKPSALSRSNLANILLLEGRDREALAAYDSSLADYRRAHDRFGEAGVLHNLAKAALIEGQYDKAQQLLVEALSLFDRLDAEPERIAVRRDLVVAYTGMGNPEAASIEGLKLAASRPGSHSPALLADLSLTAGDLAIQFNSFDEAQRDYLSASQLYSSVSNEAGLTEARRGLGLLALLREDFTSADRLFAKVVSSDSANRDIRRASRSRIFQAYAQRNLGAVDSAAASLRRAILDSHALHAWTEEASALNALGDLEGAAGRLVPAERAYRSGLRLVGTSSPEIAWNLHASRGSLLRKRGSNIAAVAELRAAVADVERMADHLTVEERRSAFLGDKWTPYEDLALAELANSNLPAAFAVSERLRAQQLLTDLARAQPSSDSQRRSDVVAGERHLHAHILSLASSLGGGDAPTSLNGLQRERRTLAALRIARSEQAVVLHQLVQREPGYEKLVRGRSLGWKEIAARLQSDEAFVEYLVTDSTTIAFVVRPHALNAVELRLAHATLRSKIDLARSLVTEPNSQERARWRPVLEGLFADLVLPIQDRGLLKDVRKLIIVPHAELHYLPFSALLEPRPSGRFLAEMYEMELTPSGSIWARSGDPGRAREISTVLAIAPHPELLPGSLDEIAAIRRSFGKSADVLRGSSASKERFRESAPGYSVIHLASTGALNKANPFLSYLSMHEANGEDGRLKANEILGLRLSASLVVLSACETALGSGNLADVPPGDDWIGLVQSFLHAGASHVLATLWRVDDRATAKFMTAFYRNLHEGRSPSESVRLAQRAALQDPSMANPFYWAGFALNGVR